MKPLTFFLSCVVALASTAAARAAEERWTVADTFGEVTASAPMSPMHRVVAGETLAPGTTLTTGGDGKLVLGDGKTVITMSANSRLTTPAESSDAMTRFTEDFGSILFKVEKRPTQHFEVQTPLIAAVVKGTQFTVTADAGDCGVSVIEGLVEVVAMQGGGKEMVPAGRAVSVNHATPRKLNLSQSQGATANGAITVAIGDGPINYAAVTNGLVQTSPAAPIFTTVSNVAGKVENDAPRDSGGSDNGGGNGGSNNGSGNGGSDNGGNSTGSNGNGGSNGGNSGGGNPGGGGESDHGNSGGSDHGNGGGDDGNENGGGSNNGNGGGNSGGGSGGNGNGGGSDHGNGSGNNGGSGNGSNGGGNGPGGNGNGPGGNGSNGGGNGSGGNGNGPGGNGPGGGHGHGKGG